MTNIKSEPLNQAAVEQVTGLSREVLRKWELRYQFPAPVRGARGQRLYTPAEVHKLQLIKSGVNRGWRPGKLVPLSAPALHDLLAAPVPALDSAHLDVEVQALLDCLGPDAPPLKVRVYLKHLVKTRGLAHFVDQYLPAFNMAVGEAWASGHLGIHAEHHYTETVRYVVLRAMPSLPLTPALPRVLMTTPPGELHGLGLLGLQAALMLQGADCLSLGTQTPALDVAQAVNDLNVGVVAISVSICLSPPAVQTYVLDLRQRLPVTCRLWVGGQGSAALGDQTCAGLDIIQSTRQATQAWQQLAAQTP